MSASDPTPPTPALYAGAALGLRSVAAEVFVPDGADPARALARATDLAVGAHPDDLEILAAPAIEAGFAAPEPSFLGVVVCDGVGGPSLAGGDADLASRRRGEQRSAAQIGRYSAVIQLAHPSDSVKGVRPEPAIAADLATILERAQPRTVWLHNPADRHETHVAVLVRSLEALRSVEPAARPGRVLGVEVWRDLDWLVGDDRVELPVGTHPHLGRALIGVYDSQISGGKRYDLAVEARRMAHATFSDSHSNDRAPGLLLALDLTAALDPDGPSLSEIAERAVERLRLDVRERLERNGG
jgi:LmbE family N-acetylglucosaminyl deacetylase